ncbi:hypothetical protein AB3S75_016328 [Citrus x aurantiifolia]
MAVLVQNILYATLFLALISETMSQPEQGPCPPETLDISQKETGNIVQGKKEFAVEVFNWCKCAQRNVTLDCDGFQTVEKPDPVQMSISGFQCVLLQGRDIIPFSRVHFKYAFDDEFPFYVFSSAPICPPN